MRRSLNVIHPGWVRSRNDGDRHFITYMQLVRLYGLNPTTCIHGNRTEGLHGVDLKHYFPRFDGNYDKGGH